MDDAHLPPTERLPIIPPTEATEYLVTLNPEEAEQEISRQAEALGEFVVAHNLWIDTEGKHGVVKVDIASDLEPHEVGTFRKITPENIGLTHSNLRAEYKDIGEDSERINKQIAEELEKYTMVQDRTKRRIRMHLERVDSIGERHQRAIVEMQRTPPKIEQRSAHERMRANPLADRDDLRRLTIRRPSESGNPADDTFETFAIPERIYRRTQIAKTLADKTLAVEALPSTFEIPPSFHAEEARAILHDVRERIEAASKTMLIRGLAADIHEAHRKLLKRFLASNFYSGAGVKETELQDPVNYAITEALMELDDETFNALLPKPEPKSRASRVRRGARIADADSGDYEDSPDALSVEDIRARRRPLRSLPTEFETSTIDEVGLMQIDAEITEAIRQAARSIREARGISKLPDEEFSNLTKAVKMSVIVRHLGDHAPEELILQVDKALHDLAKKQGRV